MSFLVFLFLLYPVFYKSYLFSIKNTPKLLSTIVFYYSHSGPLLFLHLD